MSFIVTIEYTGDDLPPNLDKKLLRAINEVLQGFKLKTNLGVDIRTTEGRVINGKQHWEGIELAGLDTKEYPNDKISWLATRLSIANTMVLSKEHYKTLEIASVYKLTEELADKFEKIYEGREWHGDFSETMKKFLKENL